ncbi:hypothetical protein JOE11_002036 [Robbsia andropogonis]|uniref:hypothetical protein n=1 Tax=Robbsia andropogonis TaxID=28092 RepID=UPI003D1D21BB
MMFLNRGLLKIHRGVIFSVYQILRHGRVGAMKACAKGFVILVAPVVFSGCAAFGFEDNSGTQLRQNLQTLNGQDWNAAIALLGRPPDGNSCPEGGDIPPALHTYFPSASAMCQWSINRGQGQRFVQTGTKTSSTMVGMTQGNGWTAPVYQSNTEAVGTYKPVIYFCFVYIYADKSYNSRDARIIGSATDGSCGP